MLLVCFMHFSLFSSCYRSNVANQMAEIMTIAIKLLLDLHVEWPSDRSILTSLGRVYLQYGDLTAAELVFHHVAALARQAAPPSDTLIDDVDVNLNR
jgi:hypothetical protein